MALKGTTRIELTNVKTGEKEVIEKDNLVTNAVASILDNPFAWQLKTPYNSQYLTGNMMPLCPNLFGGILLYTDNIPEDPDQLYAQSTNKLVGYSSNIVNNKSDPMRGSMNLNESGALEDGTGYRYVFDFTTAQANGTISSVGLTSKWGGISGYGSTEWPNTQCPTAYTEGSADIRSDMDKIEKGQALGHTVHYDEVTGVATSIYVSSKNALTAARIKLNTKHYRLRGTAALIDFKDDCYSMQTLETKTFATAEPSNRKLYHVFCDSGDGYIWGFEHYNNAAGNDTGKASINWIKIKVDDLTFAEGSWEIDAQILYFGVRSTLLNPATSSVTSITNAAILDGYLYCINYSKTGVYKIKLDNITDIELIKGPNDKITVVPGTTSMWNSYNYYSANGIATNIMAVGNRICVWDGWLNVDTFVPQRNSSTYGTSSDATLVDGWLVSAPSSGYPRRHFIGLAPLKLGAFLLGYAAYQYNGQSLVRANMLLNSPYLATINNLPTAVQKTADKTMKITYILREEVV